MKRAIALIALGLLQGGLPATAQNSTEKRWDISKIDVTKLPPASDRQGLVFDKDILPLFKASCIRCHGSERPRGGLRLDSLDTVLKGGRDGKVVVPGDSKKSLLVASVARINDGIAMPPKRRSRGGPGGAPPGNPQPPSQPGGPAGGTGAQGKSSPPSKSFTAEEVGLIRAWIDQGAK